MLYFILFTINILLLIFIRSILIFEHLNYIKNKNFHIFYHIIFFSTIFIRLIQSQFTIINHIFNAALPRSMVQKQCGSAVWMAIFQIVKWPRHRRSPGDRTSRRLSSRWSLPGVCWYWLALPSDQCQDAWQPGHGQQPIDCQETTMLTIQ